MNGLDRTPFITLEPEENRMRSVRSAQALIILVFSLVLAGCGGGGSSMTTSPPPQQSASVFTVATDAALPSVVMCQLTIAAVTLNNGSTDVSVLSQPQTVDFAQLSGLHQLIDLSSVPVGTYNSATITISSPVLGFIDTSHNPPIVNTLNGTLSQPTVTVNFAQPFSLSNADLVGLRMEFDLRQSLPTDSNGQVTGAVNPVFRMQLLDATNSEVSIDNFDAGVVGVAGSNTFTVQGPLGRQWTVQTNNNTVFDDTNEPVSSFTTDTIVSVSGELDPVTHAIDASEVEVVSNDHASLGGLLTSVRPSTGPATAADLYVRSELPAVSGISDGQITTLNLNGSEVYRIGNIALPLTTLVFNNSALAVGQRVRIGAVINASGGATTLTVHRVVLRRQGQEGTLAGNVVVQSGNAGSFQLNDDSTAGVLLPNPLTVLTTNQTNFINLSGLAALQGQTGITLRVVGFVLIDPSTNQPVLVARAVQQVTT